jgi:hypothetical protein
MRIGRIAQPLVLPIALIGVLAAVSFATRNDAAAPPIEVTGVGFTTAVGAHRHDGGGAPALNGAGAPKAGFRIDVATVHGLYPGKQVRLRLRFRNPDAFAISVRTVKTTATGPRSCPPDTALILGKHRLGQRVVVPAHGAKGASVPFGMRRAAANACQGAAFKVKVTATAIRLPR